MKNVRSPLHGSLQHELLAADRLMLSSTITLFSIWNVNFVEATLVLLSLLNLCLNHHM